MKRIRKIKHHRRKHFVEKEHKWAVNKYGYKEDYGHFGCWADKRSKREIQNADDRRLEKYDLDLTNSRDGV